MSDVPMKRIAEWLCEYAKAAAENSCMLVLGRKIKRSDPVIEINAEVENSVSGLEVTDIAGKVFLAERNRRLICACIFAKNAAPAEHVEPSEMEDFGDNDEMRVRNEIREFVLTVHKRIWALPRTNVIMGKREVQERIRNDLEDVMRELKAIRGRNAEGVLTRHQNPVQTSYPEPSERFTGRETELLQLSILTEKDANVFVCGPGGIGKTELCGKFAEAWTEATDGAYGKRTAVFLGYDGDLRSTIAWHLKIKGINESETMDQEKLFRYKLSVIAEDPTTLMVIDDLDNTEDPFLGPLMRYNFKKIFISRDPRHLERCGGIELAALPEKTSLELFYASLNDEKKEWAASRENDVLDLLRRAEHHTLTVSALADRINEHGTEPCELMKELTSGDAGGRLFNLLSLSPPEGKEKELLKAVSMLPASGMPMKRFREFSESEGDDNDEVFNKLEKKGWINLTKTVGGGVRISADPLLADILKNEFGPKGDEHNVFFNSLERFFDFGRAYSNWAEKMDLLPVLISATDAASASPYAPILYSLAGRYLRGSGNLSAALEHYMKALELREKRFGADHPSAAPVNTGIGNVYSDMGEYDKAVEYYIRALRLSGRMAGINDPSIAMTYNNVGIAYSDKGEYDKALEYYQKALEIRERVLGYDHQDTAMTYNNMGDAYSDKDEHDKALECYGKALMIRERVLGADHYYTAVTYSNISVVYLKKGDHGKALENSVKAADILKRTVGTDHPDAVAAYDMIVYIHELIGDEGFERYESPPSAEDWNFMYL